MNSQFSMGMEILASDGPAGVVEDVLYDKDGQAQYLVVSNKGFFGTDVVLPVEGGAEVSGDTVRISMTKEQISKAQPYDHARHGSASGLVSGAAGRYDQQDEDEQRS